MKMYIALGALCLTTIVFAALFVASTTGGSKTVSLDHVHKCLADKGYNTDVDSLNDPVLGTTSYIAKPNIGGQPIYFVVAKNKQDAVNVLGRFQGSIGYILLSGGTAVQKIQSIVLDLGKRIDNVIVIPAAQSQDTSVVESCS